MPFKRLDEEYRAIAPTARLIETPDKESATFIARINVNLTENDPDYAALTIADWMLGGGADFAARLVARIRVKEGLSYGVGSQLSVNIKERGANWTAFAIAAPQNVTKVEAAFQEEVAKARKEGFTEAELKAAKSGAIQQRAQQRAQDRSLAAGWMSNLEFDRTYAFSKVFEDKILALTLAEVNAALNKYIDPAKITIIKAGDFVKAASVTTK